MGLWCVFMMDKIASGCAESHCAITLACCLCGFVVDRSQLVRPVVCVFVVDKIAFGCV